METIIAISGLLLLIGSVYGVGYNYGQVKERNKDNGREQEAEDEVLDRTYTVTLNEYGTMVVDGVASVDNRNQYLVFYDKNGYVIAVFLDKHVISAIKEREEKK